jgi:hypothetical protein
MKENHKSVAILAPTLPSSNISINETKFNVFPVNFLQTQFCFDNNHVRVENQF